MVDLAQAGEVLLSDVMHARVPDLVYALLWLRRLALAAGSAYELGRRLVRRGPGLASP